MYCRERASTRETVETKIWNEMFSLRKNYYSCGFVKFVQLTDWCHIFLLCRSSWYFSGPWSCKDPCCLWEGLRALRFHQKYLNLCSEDERRSHGFGTTWRWVIYDRIFIFGWTIPLIPVAPDDILRSSEAKRSVCAINQTLFTALLPVIQSLRQTVWSDVRFSNESFFWSGSFWWTRWTSSSNRTEPS